MQIIRGLIPTAAIVVGVSAFKEPRPIATLLSSVETEEVNRDRFAVTSPDYFANARRFTSLLKLVHASLTHSKDAPTCLDTGNSAEWLSYDSRCSYSLTPSAYCCQVYAEQACPDPRLSDLNATAQVNDRIDGLDGVANPFLYSTCMADNCSAACSQSEGGDAACKYCSNVCQRSCLANLVLVCLKRTCGQTIMHLSEQAITSKAGTAHEKTEMEARRKLRMSKKEIEKVERAEVVKFALNLMEAGASVPLCTDSQLVSADTAAGIVVNAAGVTFAQSLLSCTQQYLRPDNIGRLIADPMILARSDECLAVASCERDHVRLADDRASYQVSIMDKKREQVSAMLSQ